MGITTGISAASAASIASLASTGFSAYGAVAKSQSTAAADRIQAAGVNAGDDYRAAELDRAAQYGDLKATQTSGQLTRNLNITLGNIDAVRAAAHDDPTSPTGAAVRGYAEAVGTEQKNIEVDSLTEQATQNESDAAYLRYVGNQALLSGNLGATSALMSGDVTAASDLLGGLAGYLKTPQQQGPSSNPTSGLAGTNPLGTGGVGLPAGAATGGLY